MTILQTLLLGIIQGITEFVPVSSSGHLVIAQDLLNAHTTLIFDVALHAGTLLALLLFFYKDFWQIIKGLFVKTDFSKTARLLVVATIPAALFGFVLEGYVESIFRSSLLVAINLIVVAFVMLLIEKFYIAQKTHNDFKDITPITHTTYKNAAKRPNRINKEIGNKIKKLYLENDIQTISTLIGKSVAAITKYLEKHKLL